MLARSRPVSENIADARPPEKTVRHPHGLEGPPDLVVQIVSDAFAGEDTERLPAACHRAGVEEFRLVDARGRDLLLRIHRPGPTGYQPVETDAQRHRYSTVLNCHDRLERTRNRRGRVALDLSTSEAT